MCEKSYLEAGNFLELQGPHLNAMNKVLKFKFNEGGKNTDRYFKIWVKKEDELRFSPSVHNKILSRLRGYFGGIVLLNYVFIKENNSADLDSEEEDEEEEDKMDKY